MKDSELRVHRTPAVLGIRGIINEGRERRQNPCIRGNEERGDQTWASTSDKFVLGVDEDALEKPVRHLSNRNVHF